MKIEIYKDGNKSMCKIPGQGDVSLLELLMGVEMIPASQIKIKWGPDVPEIEVTCPLEKQEAACIEQIKASLEKKYNQA